MAKQEQAKDNEIVTTRVINAPKELVFDAFTDPKHLAHWWGPNGFTTTTKSFSFREGGEWILIMHGPDGRDYDNRIAYKKIERPDRIEYAHVGDGGTAHFSTVVTFEEEGKGKTKITLRATFESKDARDFVVREYKADEGGKQTIARLADYVESRKLGA